MTPDLLLPTDSTGTLIPIEVPVFHPAYREAPHVSGHARVYGASLHCICKTERTLRGMMSLSDDGRFTNHTGDPRFTEFSLGSTWLVCGQCSRIYHRASTVAAGNGGTVPVIARYATSFPFMQARREYISALNDEPFTLWGELRVGEKSQLHNETDVDEWVYEKLAVTAFDIRGTISRLDDVNGERSYLLQYKSNRFEGVLSTVLTEDIALSEWTVEKLLRALGREHDQGYSAVLVHLVGDAEAHGLAVHTRPTMDCA